MQKLPCEIPYAKCGSLLSSTSNWLHQSLLRHLWEQSKYLMDKRLVRILAVYTLNNACNVSRGWLKSVFLWANWYAELKLTVLQSNQPWVLLAVTDVFTPCRWVWWHYLYLSSLVMTRHWDGLFLQIEYESTKTKVNDKNHWTRQDDCFWLGSISQGNSTTNF